LERFELYLVLGDDIVIAHKGVADQYLLLIQELGCPINMFKSVISDNGSFEFAKRFILRGTDVSPVSFKELSIAMNDIQSLLSLLKNLKVSNPSMSITAVLSAYGYGYKAVSKAFGLFQNISLSIARLILLLTIPGSPFSRLTSISKWMLSSRPNHFLGVKGNPSLLEFIYQRYTELTEKPLVPDVPRSKKEIKQLLNYVSFNSFKIWNQQHPETVLHPINDYLMEGAVVHLLFEFYRDM